MANMEENKKRRKMNRNKKKAWRKHTDITDVEEHLDDVRLQERTGGLVAEKTDDQLFFVDKAQVKDEPMDDGFLTVKKNKSIGPLKCHALLEPDPHTKPITRKRGHNADKPTFKKARLEAGKVSSVQQLAQKQKANAATVVKQKRAASRQPTQQAQAEVYDLWGEKGSKTEQELASLDEHYIKYTKKYRPKVPKHHYEKPSEVKAVEVAHPGASYNPSYEDHQDLLLRAHEVEIVKLKQHEKIERALTAKFPSVKDRPTEATWLAEMSQGLNEEEEVENTQEINEEDLDNLSNNPPVRRDNKKTETQRRRASERKKMERNIAQKKNVKSNEQELFRLKTINNEIAQKERGMAARAQRKLLKREAKKDVPKRLGPIKYQAADLDLKLSDEIEGSLRKLKPEGNLLEDRYKSLQKRSILEPRVKAKVKRKYAKKYVVKRSHREPIE